MTTRSRALCAALVLFLLALSACANVTELPSDTPAPTPLPRPETGGCWAGSFNATDELLRALGVDLTPRLKAALTGEIRLTIEPDGRCSLRGDYASCAAPLREALTVFLRELQQEESGEALSGLQLAGELGGDPSLLAGALCEELLPPVFTLSGRLADSKREINWEDGTVSTLAEQGEGLRFTLPGRGDLFLLPAE